ncbi:MAG TPA: AAA family ATPase, partial [Micromonosporaceae bacterium]
RWRFVGRTDELRRVAAAVANGRGLVVGGPSGVGKSSLLRRAVTVLDGDHWAIWHASANAATGALPFGTLAHLLPLDQPAGLSPAGLLRWAAEALRHQAAGRPVVLAIDDINLADPLSAALIALITRAEQATVVATLRTGEPAPEPVATLWQDGLLDRTELVPLSMTDTAELLGHVLAGPVDPHTAQRLHRLSQGNALLLRELVLAACAAGDFTQSYGLWQWTGRLELAPSLIEVVDARIGRLSPNVRTVMELVAFGEPVGLNLIIDATDRASVEAAEERQLIRVDTDDRRRPVRLAHPIFGEVVRRRCPVVRSRRLLALLAELVERAGARRRDDLLRIAVLRLESETASDPVLLQAAGRQAFAGYDVRRAARLVSAARRAGGGVEAGLLLATILLFADQPGQAASVLDEIRSEQMSGDELARWHAAKGLVAHWGLGDPGAADELANVAAGLPDPADRTRVMAYESLMRLHQMEPAAAQRLAHAVVDRPAASAGSRALAQTTIAHLHALRGQAGQAHRAIAAVEADAAGWRSGAPQIQLALELARGTSLILAGDLTGVDALAAAEFADLAQAGEFGLGSGYLSIVLGQAARLRGRVREALRHQRRACAVLDPSKILAALANAERAHAAALSGERSEAEHAIAEADRLQDRTMAVLYPWLEHARCWVAVAAGDLSRAVVLTADLAARLRADSLLGHEAV